LGIFILHDFGIFLRKNMENLLELVIAEILRALHKCTDGAVCKI